MYLMCKGLMNIVMNHEGRMSKGLMNIVMNHEGRMRNEVGRMTTIDADFVLWVKKKT
jgi:hypothetical protein